MHKNATKEAYDAEAIEARWQARWAAEGRGTVDPGHAARPLYSLIEFPSPSCEGLITTRSTPRNTSRVHVFAATPSRLGLHNAEVSDAMSLTLPQFAQAYRVL